MINPVSVIKLLNERKNFVANHPEFIGYILNIFGAGMEKGDKIEVRVKKADGEWKEVNIELQESDVTLFDELQKVVEQIRS